MEKGLAEAERAKAALAETTNGDRLAQSSTGKVHLDQDWDLTSKTMKFHSLVLQQDVDGPALFAEQMDWPSMMRYRTAPTRCMTRRWQKRSYPLICRTGYMASPRKVAPLDHYACTYSLYAVGQQYAEVCRTRRRGSVVASEVTLANSPWSCPRGTSRHQISQWLDWPKSGC
ncbi:hypothetical protein BJY00DRAFT_282168 [Aspergillus carlsbadensis]|nr:hypothetical protein BJY00DRAFT_282168 [Aspergillus carlsbadensis]